jgi:hypothetical protein
MAMRRAFLMMLLAGASSHAQAAWVEVGKTDISTVYADPATIRRIGPIARMWFLLDYKVTQLRDTYMPFGSARDQAEFNCAEDRFRVLNFSFHSGKMASGEIVHSRSEPFSWEPIPPQTGIDVLLKTACGK